MSTLPPIPSSPNSFSALTSNSLALVTTKDEKSSNVWADDSLDSSDPLSLWVDSDKGELRGDGEWDAVALWVEPLAISLPEVEVNQGSKA